MPTHKIPWYPRYPADFLNSKKVLQLTGAQIGLYNVLIDLMWLDHENCRLPDDAAILARIFPFHRIFNWRWRADLERLVDLGCIVKHDGYLYNERLTFEYERACNRSFQASVSAGKFNEKHHVTSTSPATSQAHHRHASGDLNSTESTSVSRGRSASHNHSHKKLNTPLYSPLFERFWSEYPRKVGKPKAAAAFRAVERDAEAIIGSIAAWRSCDQWVDPQFIPHPATFLNQRRWEDAPANGNGSGGAKIDIAHKAWAQVGAQVQNNGRTWLCGSCGTTHGAGQCPLFRTEDL